ncbi:MAG TPA: hypothetical protein VMX97_00145 [Hyphomicrobiaceae bacterium]|nr:hypothetical protein [Hyphomicrobiaceae bacterium]
MLRLVSTLAGFAGFLLMTSLASSSVAVSEDVQAVYQQRCGACHEGSAKELALGTLVVHQGAIITRKRKLELRAFLNQHGRSRPDEIDQLYTLLQNHLAEGGPPAR